jgi:hypothetical protein
VQWLLLVLVVAGFAVIEFRLLRDWLRLAPVRRVVKREAVVYRTPISAQWSRGWWGRGNAKGMQLVVHERSFELSYQFPGGSLFSTEWYCRGSDAEMKTGKGNFLPPLIKRDCIALSIPAIDHSENRQEILLASRPMRNDLRSTWEALAACGVRTVGDAPAS